MESETTTRLKNYMESLMSLSFLAFMVVILIVCLVMLLINLAYKYDYLNEQYYIVKKELEKQRSLGNG